MEIKTVPNQKLKQSIYSREELMQEYRRCLSSLQEYEDINLIVINRIRILAELVLAIDYEER